MPGSWQTESSGFEVFMSFRPKDTLQMLADAGADPDALLVLERQEKADYIELGLPRQGDSQGPGAARSAEICGQEEDQLS